MDMLYLQRVFQLLIALLVISSRTFGIDAGMPNPPSSPTVVTVGVFVADIIRLAEVDETFEAEVILYARWKDPRLAFDAEEYGADVKIFQGEFQFNEIYSGWWPQFVVLNRIGAGEADGIKVEVYSDGRVRYLEERNITVQSTMNLRKFPFDQQELSAILIPFGNSTEQVILKDDPAITEASEDYVQLNNQINIAEWKLLDVRSEVITVKHRFFGEPQEVSQLKVYFTLQREPGHIIWDILFPLFILIILMWSIFWIDSNNLTDRLNIAFIGILTIVAYQFLIDGSLPRIPYFTFTDAIVFLSFIIMAGVVFQSLLLWYLHKKKREQLADLIDKLSLWGFPFVYLGAIIASYYIYIR
ncbi:hypothetical protein [Cerasicoccus fimbriatus]|uniref:hypothetical protein n=1 Tax=Cerasicoccus fimbriatus TaxID=3014554 RepID=UPI0022B2E00C|nr:hypothetical protein [Cerasicoccus sp. TK19100]